MLKITAIVVGILIASVLIYATTKPDTFQVERSMRIKAPPQIVFALINDLRSWDAWSSWTKRDPAMKSRHSGATSGMGAVYEWEGNKGVGKGRMEIVDMSPPSRINIALDFIEPIETRNTVEFKLEPIGGFTEVIWNMRGPMPFASKLFSIFVSMDTMIGRDFETGLSNLKALAEKPAPGR